MEYDESHKNEQSPGAVEIRANQGISNKNKDLPNIHANEHEQVGLTSLFFEPKCNSGKQEAGDQRKHRQRHLAITMNGLADSCIAIILKPFNNQRVSSHA